IDDDEGIRETYKVIFTPEVESDILSRGSALFDIDFSADLKKNKPKIRKTADYKLSVAETGMQGITLVKDAVLENRPFGVAFIDMKMPGMNGAETSRQIWDIDPKIRIVIVTAYSEYTPDDIIATTGRDDIFYLRKPFNHEEILQFARALTNEWNLEQKQEILQAELKEANEALENMNRSLESMNRTLESMNKNLKEKVEKQAAMIVQTDKMASVGLLAAGVAHEINNPLSFINANLSALKRYMTKIGDLHQKYNDVELFLRYSGLENAPALLEELEQFKRDNKTELIMVDIKDLTEESLDGIERIKTIVNDLKTFSRIDEADYTYLDINKAIDTTINILWNEIKYKAEIIKHYGNIPDVRCFPQKISQVFMNLLLNAVQAIEEHGTITINTQLVSQDNKQEDFVEIKISDTGCGIPKENINRLFEPFFTTKPVGTGTGLGLSITYEIIKAHKGIIEVSSEVGQGTEISVILPTGV
ncbi:MAG: response regulator, partial [Desulfamplus sp.]|nr:response regulator [Desulfamplus sp.]